MDVNIIGSPVTSAVKPVLVTGSGASADRQSSSAQTKAPTLEQVQRAVDNINASLAEKGNSNSVQFVVDPSSKRVVVQVLEPQSGKVIRQIPSEEIIQMGMVLGQKLGLVIDQQA